MAKVYIDPGHNHSGADTGAVGYGLREQDITVEIGIKLKALLLKNGFAVKMSRESIYDTVADGLNASLAGRYNDANSWEADVFISIHCNSANTKAYGTETYCVSLDSDAGRLAELVQKRLIEETGRYDRGVKTANFAVILHTDMPAVLVETGFIDNYSDNRFLASDRGKDLYAAAICMGVCDYFGVKYVSESEVELMSQEYEELKAKNDSQDKIINIIGADIDRNTNAIYGLEKQMARYDYIDGNMPVWAVPTITKLVDKGYLKGDDEGKLNLTEDMMRLYVVNDRGGLYGD